MNENEALKVFSENLLRLMKIHNITDEQLAEKTHVSKPTVVQWCKGEKLPYKAVIGALTGALCCGEKDLFGGQAPELEQGTAASKPVQEQKPAETAKENPVKQEPVKAAEADTVNVQGQKTEQPKKTVPKKQAASEKTPLFRPAGNREEIINAMRLMKRNVKAITKSMTADEAKAWVETTTEAAMGDISKSVDNCINLMNDVVSTLVSMSAAGIEGSFREGIIVDEGNRALIETAANERYRELLDAAAGASDDAIATATAILRNWKK